MSKTNKKDSFWRRLISNQMFIPLLALLLLAVINLIHDPSFFKITIFVLQNQMVSRLGYTCMPIFLEFLIYGH